MVYPNDGFVVTLQLIKSMWLNHWNIFNIIHFAAQLWQLFQRLWYKLFFSIFHNILIAQIRPKPFVFYKISCLPLSWVGTWLLLISFALLKVSIGIGMFTLIKTVQNDYSKSCRIILSCSCNLMCTTHFSPISTHHSSHFLYFFSMHCRYIGAYSFIGAAVGILFAVMA